MGGPVLYSGQRPNSAAPPLSRLCHPRGFPATADAYNLLMSLMPLWRPDFVSLMSPPTTTTTFLPLPVFPGHFGRLAPADFPRPPTLARGRRAFCPSSTPCARSRGRRPSHWTPSLPRTSCCPSWRCWAAGRASRPWRLTASQAKTPPPHWMERRQLRGGGAAPLLRAIAAAFDPAAAPVDVACVRSCREALRFLDAPP